jgi:hypothetical protein
MHLTRIAGDWDIQKSRTTKWRQTEGALEMLPSIVTSQQRERERERERGSDQAYRDLGMCIQQ